MKTVNLTIELQDEKEVLAFENWLKQYVNIKDIIILPDTKELYESDKHFRDLTKSYKDARKARNNYINKNK